MMPLPLLALFWLLKDGFASEVLLEDTRVEVQHVVINEIQGSVAMPVMRR